MTAKSLPGPKSLLVYGSGRLPAAAVCPLAQQRPPRGSGGRRVRNPDVQGPRELGVRSRGAPDVKMGWGMQRRSRFTARSGKPSPLQHKGLGLLA